jgi:hypothetical protein
MSDQKPLNISRYLSFSFLAVLSINSPLSADPTIDDLMGYSRESVVRCNPTLVERFFNKHPEKRSELREGVAYYFKHQRIYEIAAHIDGDWIAAKVMKSINNVNKPGISWVYGAQQNLDWRATFNLNESLQQHWKEFLRRTGKLHEDHFDPSLEIFKARYVQDWILFHTYKADPTQKVELAYIQPKTRASILATEFDSKIDPSQRDTLRDSVRSLREFRETAISSRSLRKRPTRRSRHKVNFDSWDPQSPPSRIEGYLSIHSDIAIHRALGMTFDLIKGAIGAIEFYQALRKNPRAPYRDQLAIDVLEKMLAFKSIDQFKKDTSSREELSKPEVRKFLPSDESSPVSEFDIIRAKAYGAMESLETNIRDTILAQRASEGSSSSSDDTRQHMKILSDKGILTTSTRMLLMVALKQIEGKFLELKRVATEKFGAESAQRMIQQAPDLLELYKKVVALREQNETWQKSSGQLLRDKALASALSDGSFHRKPNPRMRMPIPNMAPAESQLQ